ncbi:MAG: tetratricopeptide repeat protein [Flavobacteriaceae bacterium]|nr:tetratricopeptide repeat protein [Flavobacteriaceae bacterium]
MKKSNPILLFLFTFYFSTAQSTLMELVEEGIKFHQAGDYEKSIERYKEALKIDPNSSMVLYEMSYSYLRDNKLDEALSYANRVLAMDDENKRLAYMVKGAALDLMGKTQESNALFEQAIEETGPHYLYYYNMGFNYFKANDDANAEKNLLEALNLNPVHNTSHYLLSHIHNDRGNKVQAKLAALYFLILEPETNRSLGALDIIENNTSGHVKVDENKPNTININLSPKENNPFGPAEMMMSLLEASKSMEKNEGKSELELFTENTKSFFNVLGELNKDKPDDIWWGFYIPFFYELAQANTLPHIVCI